MTYQQQITITTQGHGDMHNISEQIASVVNASAIKTGIVNIFNIGSTAAVGTIRIRAGPRGGPSGHSGQVDSPQPQLRPRTRVARRQRPLTFAGHSPRAIIDGPHCRWPAHAGHVATNLSSRMRRARAAAHGCCYRDW